MSTRRSSYTKTVTDPTKDKILWASVSRNDTILVEAGEDPFDGAVQESARAILAKKYTAGWEYYTHSDGLFRRRNSPTSSGQTRTTPKLKAIKFHVYEHHSGDWGDLDADCYDGGAEGIVWVFAAVYNPEAWDNYNLVTSDVKNFLQKLVGLTAMPRLSEPAWRTGPNLACQRAFASTLQQRMEEVTTLGKMARVQQSLDETKSLMHDNVTAILQREDQLRDLDRRGSKLSELSSVFQKNTQRVRRRIMLQNAKYGVAVGTAVTALVAVVVVPPILVAL